MADLSPKARALIDESRSVIRPSAADRLRVDAALRERLGSAAMPADPSAASSVLGAAKWKVLIGAAVGVCAIGVGVRWSATPAPRAVEQAPALQPPAAPAPV